MDFDRRKRVIVVIVMMAVMSTVIQSHAMVSGEERELRIFEKLFMNIRSVFAEEQYEGIIRFHVKANSNSEEDQALKLKVRDAVLEEINGILEEETVKQYDIEAFTRLSSMPDGEEQAQAKLTLSETRGIILENIEIIETVAEEVIKENGYEYEAGAELGITFIPKKTYGDVTFPAGNYEALTVTIGEGEGDNWWCVLFPPLCIIDPSGSTLGGMEVEELEKDAAFGTVAGSKGIILKFKTQELLEKYGQP